MLLCNWVLSTYIIRLMRKKEQFKIEQPFGHVVQHTQLIALIQQSLQQSLILGELKVSGGQGSAQGQQEWQQQDLRSVLRLTKEVLAVVESLKIEEQQFQRIKLKNSQLQLQVEESRQQIEETEKKLGEKVRLLTQENRVLKESHDKIKKTLYESQQQFKVTLADLKQKQLLLEKRCSQLQEDKKGLLIAVQKCQLQLKNNKHLLAQINSKEQTTNTLKQKTSLLQQLRYNKQHKKQALSYPPVIHNYSSNHSHSASSIPLAFEELPGIQRLAMADPLLLSRVVAFLRPNETLMLACVNRSLRWLLLKSRHCVMALCRSVAAVKQRRINYFKKHIDYFQAKYHSLPQEVLQTAFYRYYVLKEAVGPDVNPALNASAAVFEGKLSDSHDNPNSPDSPTLKSRSPSTNHNTNSNNFSLSSSHFNQNNASSSSPIVQRKFSGTIPGEGLSWGVPGWQLLEIDGGIVAEYEAQSRQQKQKVSKLVDIMQDKLNATFQLYRADPQTSKLFILNVIRNFSRLFVIAKTLYAQAQSLQGLNWLLLGQLSRNSGTQIEKNLQVQDLRAQLQAECKMKLFFTDKSIKSQQKALLEENMKLTFEMKYEKLSDSMNVICAQRDDLLKNTQELKNSHELLAQEHRETRKHYESLKEKHHKIIEELTVVKETILKMNII